MISIIVPIYNAEKYLTDCIDSLIGQSTTEPLEIILIDDASTDGSLTIAKQYAKKHAEDPLRKVKLFTQQHSGQSIARNLGMDNATGEYIAFVDADDRIAPDWCARHLKAIKKVDYVQSGYRRTADTEEKGWWVGIRRLPEHRYRYTSPCMRLYRRSALRNIRFEGGMIYEDILFSADLWLSGATCRQIRYAGYLYTNNPDSTTSRPHPDAQRRVLEELHNKLPYASWKGRQILWLTILRLRLYFILEQRKEVKRALTQNKVMACIGFFICFSLFAYAGEASYQDLRYTLDENHLTAEVALNPRATGELLIPEQIKAGQNTYTVVSIADRAFKGCKNLTAIVLPKTLERVYRSAFDGTGIMLNKTNWLDGCLWIDSILIATDKNIKPRFIVPEDTRLIAAGAFQGNKTIVRVELPSTLKRIDHETFKDCKNLQKVTIPASVVSIGEDVFTGSGIYTNDKKWKKGALIIEDCLVATNDELPAKYIFKNKTPIRLIAERAFANRKDLKSVTIPATITAISAAAFYQCENLTDVIIPSSVREVGNFAFYNCQMLKSALLPDHLERLGMGAFYGCINLREQKLSERIEILEQGTFFTCRALKRLNMPSRLRRIDNGVFAGCSGLEEIKLPETVEYIGENAFAGCSVIREITIPAKVNSLPKQMCQGCTRLYRANLPEGLYAVGDEAFDGCLALEKINIPKSTFRIGARAFRNCQQLRGIDLVDHIHMLEEGAFTECKMLEEITLPQSLKLLHKNAFAQCINLRRVTFNKDLKEIGEGAFSQCRSIRELTFGDSLQVIGNEAFMACKNLRKISFPITVKRIGDRAFQDCESLKQPLFPENIEIGKNAFKGTRQ